MPPRPRGSGGPGGGAGGTLAMRPQAGAVQPQPQEGSGPPPPAEEQKQEVLYNPTNWKNNFQVVYYLRIYATVVAGVVAGVLGVTGWQGFAVYLVSQLLVVPLIVAKAEGNTAKFFPSWDKVVLEHVFSSTALMSYVLCWMLAFNLGHVY
ncbi:ER membrane complex subunit 6 [Raphidocelis subcapitata]|uniref:ER membrane protein complex subunit 6 n=1 Tax=Raphidocelis subcapitata TaxID=307507 RepID=A0A2V0P617_9CHLO|nr:ER membrane complex subunit 6 [Raphidocelis subcapitata]|eukprot:GBF93300.1 ER membrane complex subunit 6 [Raphidocelis subcapitata]